MGGKPSAPTAPNPVDTTRAATSTNIGTTIANAFLNNTNQYTPEGSLRYDQTGTYSWTDPYTGTTADIPQFSATVQYSPQQQAIQDQANATKYNLAGLANAQSGRLQSWLAAPMNLDTAPAAGDPSTIQGAEGYKTTIDPTWDITKTYGDQEDVGAARDKYENALMQRLNPQLALEKGGITQQLADQGIRYGSTAYTNAMDNYNRQANDARFAAVGAAGDEQARQMGIANQQATFQNQAQNQAFQQNALSAEFANTGLGQQLAASTAKFNAMNTARQQYMNEQYAARNQPINEINSLLAGSQIQSPNFVNTPNNQIPTTDVAGLINTKFSQDMDVYKQESTNYNAMIGGIMGMMGGAMKMGMSDRREKENIDKIATVFAASSKGKKKELPIYSYSFKKDPASVQHIGPMAQDVEKITPEAVEEHDGIKYVDHGAVMGSILRAS